MAIEYDKVKIKELPQKINLDETDLIIVEDSEDTKQSTTKSLRTFLKCDERLSALEDKLTTKIDANTNLDNNRYNELKNADLNINKRCDDIKTEINKLQNQDIATETELTKLSEKIDTNTNNITNLSTRVSTVETDNTANKNKITAIESNIKTITNNVTALQNDNTTNKEKLADLYNLHDELVEQINQLDTDIGKDIQDQVAVLDAQIKKVYDDLLAMIDFYHHHQGASQETIDAIYKVGSTFITIDPNSDPNQLFNGSSWISCGHIKTQVEETSEYVDLYMWTRIN